MNVKEFITRATKHYNEALEVYKSTFGVMAVSDRYIEDGVRTVVDEEYAGKMWREISEQSGLHLHVAADYPEVTFAILSRKAVTSPASFYHLWELVKHLNADYSDQTKLNTIYCYEGPYKTDMPDELVALVD